VNRILCAGVSMILFISVAAIAQSGRSAAGHWEGSIALPNGELKVILDLDRDAQGRWIGDIDIPDQGLRDLLIERLSVEDTNVGFVLPIGLGDPTFQGQLSGEGDTLSGNFTQSGQTFKFTLKRTGEAKVYVPPKAAALPETFLGQWEGNMESPDGTLRIVFHLANKEGSAQGTIDSPDQQAMGIPMSEISTKGTAIKITVRMVSGEYSGKLGDDGKTLTGEWSQGGGTLQLILRKTAEQKK
jgi:hypothetical protein